MTKLDVLIQGSCGFFLFSLLTKRAQRWAAQHVDTQLGNSSSFPCDDTRMAQDIAACRPPACVSPSLSL